MGRTSCVRARSFQSCSTLCQTMDCSPPGSSVHGILQARILEWVAISSSRGSRWIRDHTHDLILTWLPVSPPRDGTRVSCLMYGQVGSLPLAPPGKPTEWAGHLRSGERIYSCYVFPICLTCTVLLNPHTLWVSLVSCGAGQSVTRACPLKCWATQLPLSETQEAALPLRPENGLCHFFHSTESLWSCSLSWLWAPPEGAGPHSSSLSNLLPVTLWVSF